MIPKPIPTDKGYVNIVEVVDKVNEMILFLDSMFSNPKDIYTERRKGDRRIV